MTEEEITSGARHSIKFFINEKEYTVWETWKYTAESKLVDFIREDAKLRGTKIMCREGGCGTCVVTVSEKEPLAGTANAKAVPSCTVPLFSCDGWRITTVEYLGDKRRGYDPIQKSLVDFNAIQCGYCTPGMVMSMYSLQQSNGDANIEDILDGNICRCTGYRPILDAFKSLKSSQQYLRKDECENCPSRLRESGELKTHCTVQQNGIELDLASGKKWIKVEDINSAFCVLQSFVDAGKPYRVMLGINEQGAYKYDPVENYLDVTYVQELRRYSLGADDKGIVIGSAVTFSGAIFLLNEASKMQGYAYAAQIAKLLERDTNLPTRNVASVGEELMMKNRHKEFISDVFVYMEAAGATVTIAKSANSWEKASLTRFFNMNMNGRLLISLNLPKMAENCYFRVFKISRRYQNCKAIVNAGFLMKVDKQRNYKVVEKPRIVYGGIRPNFIHAWGTEMFLLNKNLSDASTLDGAMKMLDKEVNPDNIQDEPSPFYRKSLTKSLLYKTILGILGEQRVKNKIKSGATDIIRKNNKGTQDLGINIADVSPKPLYKPVQRLDAHLLSSGEAEFTDDIPTVERELFGAFVLTTVAKCQLDTVDASEALKMEKVVRFITASDIPGVNNCMVFGAIPLVDVEPIFVYDKVEAAGQAVGLILAWNREVAYEAARKVKITYKNAEKPIVRARDSLAKVEDEGNLKKHIQLILATPPTSIEIPTREISGEQEHGYQFHFSLDTQSCLSIPQSDSIDVYCATQWMDHTQAVIASALGVRDNYVNITVKRVGGAFGSKITRASHPASACAVAAFVTNRPVRVIMDLEANMRMLGKREPYVCRYKVKFSETGKIVFLKAYLLCDSGWTKNEAYAIIKLPYFQNVYSASGWEALTGYLLTDTPANTYCRAPGGLNAIAFIEYIMEHISFVLKKDPLEVRAANYMRLGDPLLIPGEFFDGENLIPRMVEQLKRTGEYDQRKRDVAKFNAENRWKKRGLAVSTSSNIVNYYANTYVAYVTIYHHDGSVAVSHSGIEFGTGVNIKVAQTVATYLDVPLEKVSIKANNSLTGNNSAQSALSISSELNSYAAMQACKILVERLAPFKEQLGVDANLQQIAEIALRSKVDLSASYMFGGPSDKDIQNYVTYQVIFNEVEVDILTGEFKVRRVDILQDVGHSLNPLVDIGQVEGGYVFGQSLWTTEQIIYDENNGQLLTNNSYSYKPMETRDIPEDFRVALLSNTFNRKGVLQTKASGEPPTNLGVSVLFALKKAIDSARKDAGNEDWFQMNGPVGLEDVYRHSLTTSAQFTF